MKRYGLRDDQFARIETLLPGAPVTVGRSSELGNRLFVEAVIWKFRSGAPWRDLPERFGDWKNLSVHSQAYLNKVARQLNERPRQTLQYRIGAGPPHR